MPSFHRFVSFLLVLLRLLLAPAFAPAPPTSSPSNHAKAIVKTASRNNKQLTQPIRAVTQTGTLAETVGGGWAGWECHFSFSSGLVLPVPADDLPEALREWEVGVWGWEGIAYDAVREDEGTVDIERRAARFMVEAGCGCENVGKQKSHQRLQPLAWARGGLGYVTADRLTDSLLRLEAALSSPPSSSSFPSSTPSASAPAARRARVILDLRCPSVPPSTPMSSPQGAFVCSVRDPVRLYLERRFTSALPATDPFKAAIDQTSISRHVGVPCFGEPERGAAGREWGGSGVWVRWSEDREVLEVGWRPEVARGQEGEAGVEEKKGIAWRIRLGQEACKVVDCEWVENVTG